MATHNLAGLSLYACDSAYHHTSCCSLSHTRVPCCRARLRAQHYTVLDWLQLLLPCVKWLRTYKIKEYLLVRAS